MFEKDIPTSTGSVRPNSSTSYGNKFDLIFGFVHQFVQLIVIRKLFSLQFEQIILNCTKLKLGLLRYLNLFQQHFME